LQEILKKAGVIATHTVHHKYFDRLFYHDVDQLYLVVRAAQEISEAENFDDEDLKTTVLAAWLANLGLKHLDPNGR